MQEENLECRRIDNMKRIEEIERLSLEELEKISEDAGVKIPAKLNDSIEDILCAERLHRNARKSRVFKSFAWIPAVAVVAGIRHQRVNMLPEDTFENPQEAYAEVERVFGMISDRINKGKSIADATLSDLNKASEVLEKFYN